MKKIIFLFLFLSIFLFSNNLIAEETYFKEGLWEISSKMIIKGQGGMHMPATKIKSCISKEDMIPPTDSGTKPGDGKCRTFNKKISGNTVSWEFECKDPEGDMKGKGTITYYKGYKFKGKLTIITREVSMEQEMEGKWLGPCKK